MYSFYTFFIFLSFFRQILQRIPHPVGVPAHPPMAVSRSSNGILFPTLYIASTISSNGIGYITPLNVISAQVKEVNNLEDVQMTSLAKAISSGSLRGARGNSGVILSQLLRGFTKGIRDLEELDAVALARAVDKGVETAYKAVMKPKEGTILTVARGVADKALELAEDAEDLQTFLEDVLEEGRRVLAKTPDMLPVLKEAGVVDSGGQGLMVVLEGAFDAFMGKEVDLTFDGGESAKVVKITPQAEADIKFGYCTEFIIVLNKEFTAEDEVDFKAYLSSLGDSIVCVADDEVVKIHVHTNDPGLAIQRALTYGSLSRIKIDNMREEHQEKLIKDAEKIAAQQAEEAAKAPKKEVGFISVSIGEGFGQIFRDLGVDYLIEGGQTMNPSTEDMLNAISKVNAEHIFILPNNKNIILAANQAKALTKDKDIIVIPTKTVPQGITAVINYVPEKSVEDNEKDMTEEITRVKTGQITYAVRDTHIDDKEIHEGDIMGIGDHGMLAVGKEVAAVAKETVEQMVDDETELISIYYGEGFTEEEAEKLAGELEEQYDYCDVEVNCGGQPIYYCIISVE